MGIRWREPRHPRYRPPSRRLDPPERAVEPGVGGGQGIGRVVAHHGGVAQRQRAIEVGEAPALLSGHDPRPPQVHQDPGVVAHAHRRPLQQRRGLGGAVPVDEQLAELHHR